eukprot:scaffold82450_cov47-Phaeocystis_antarctica.AAC.2
MCIRDSPTPPYPCARAALRPLPAPLSQPPHAGGNPPSLVHGKRWAVQRSAQLGAAVGAVADRRIAAADGLGPRRAGEREGENGAKHVMPARGAGSEPQTGGRPPGGGSSWPVRRASLAVAVGSISRESVGRRARGMRHLSKAQQCVVKRDRLQAR